MRAALREPSVDRDVTVTVAEQLSRIVYDVRDKRALTQLLERVTWATTEEKVFAVKHHHAMCSSNTRMGWGYL